jgi:hypothetical protein
MFCTWCGACMHAENIVSIARKHVMFSQVHAMVAYVRVGNACGDDEACHEGREEVQQ